MASSQTISIDSAFVTTTKSAVGYKSLVPVTKADADLPDGLCDGLWVETAGTINYMDATGVTRTNVWVQAGINPLKALQVRLGGTATGISAGYV